MLLLAAFICPTGLHADLKPDEVAVIAVRRSEKSRELAAYYVRMRGIPESHICLIDVVPGKDLKREDWESRVRPAIRQWIAKNKLEAKLRCLVTTWDVPLKIGRVDPSAPMIATRSAYLRSERAGRVARLTEILQQVNALGRSGMVPPAAPMSPESSPEDLARQMAAAFDLARERLQSRDGSAARQGLATLSELFARVGGLSALVSNQSRRPSRTEAQNVQLAALQGRLLGLQQGQAALEGLPESVQRDQRILELAEAREGLLGSLRWIHAQLALLERNETYASFDSELSLLYWPPYPLLRWQPNVLHHAYDGSYARWLRTTLMVARLDAPSYELARRMIDDAIRIEKQGGPQGIFYIDARGIGRAEKEYRHGSYGDYDHCLFQLAEMLKGLDEKKVVFNADPELFQEGECPQAALYCGWYSLAKYIDAFQWVPGAVGYHIASAEATTLRRAGSQVWCKRMLEEGVAATLGPVYEPYLVAFPRPDEFYTLLFSGRYSLVEAYYRTKPFNSWVMVLLGDPLYNPFRNRPVLTDADVPARFRQLLDGSGDAEIQGGSRPSGGS